MHTLYALLKNKLSDVHPLHNIDLTRDVAYLKAVVTKEMHLQFDASELGEWPSGFKSLSIVSIVSSHLLRTCRDHPPRTRAGGRRHPQPNAAAQRRDPLLSED